jgi:hypothetical protein
MKSVTKFLIPAATVALLLQGCSTYDSRVANRETLYLGAGGSILSKPGPATFDNVSYWDGEHVSGPPSVRIDLGEQRAYFYKGNELVGISLVSSGREGFGTPDGSFKIIQKNKDHRSNLYGDFVDAAGTVVVRDVDVTKDRKPPGTTFLGARMPYFMRIHGGVGMHAGFLPGYAASHGCIRMPEHMAERFFANVSVGTPVQVTH